ncbi:2'-5' RNA ligase family protein [Rhizobium sp. 2MFCol3.1]|uniref:2'-5' RNA ligase family protein n=1 Tax=Rhizobium sp. 2MFCol3.1 TaxID=1246459 RepID=UPI0003809C5E|nr:2'-5' RNA ligase family protein [Rhizobium sp. 2MFCol3.1]
MKTRHPLILTARIAEADLQMFDDLRQTHFPPQRNFLRAHLTMFHRLPGEYFEQIVRDLQSVCEHQSPIVANVTGIRHLGAGVAFAIESLALTIVRDELKRRFNHWLGPQDMGKWQPHITIQNKTSKARADSLYEELSSKFQALEIMAPGLDLWRYLGGPWAPELSVTFSGAPF